ERIKIVADALKIPLLPFTAVDEGDVVLGEGEERIGLRKIGDERVGMLFGIANDVRHARLFPAIVNRGMAFLAGGGSYVLLSRGDGRDGEKKRAHENSLWPVGPPVVASRLQAACILSKSRQECRLAAMSRGPTWIRYLPDEIDFVLAVRAAIGIKNVVEPDTRLAAC